MKELLIMLSSTVNSQQSLEVSYAGTGFIILLIIGALGVSLLMQFLRSRCPSCQQFRALQEVDRQFLGTASSQIEQDAFGQNQTVYKNRYRITYRCRFCGATHVVDRVERS